MPLERQSSRAISYCQPATTTALEAAASAATTATMSWHTSERGPRGCYPMPWGVRLTRSKLRFLFIVSDFSDARAAATARQHTSSAICRLASSSAARSVECECRMRCFSGEYVTNSTWFANFTMSLEHF